VSKIESFCRVYPDLKKLPEVFKQYPEIQAVYLFGSRAAQKEHLESDIDLAVIAEGEVKSTTKLDILADLAGQGFCDVDLVILNTDDIVLKYEVIRQNHIVYQRSNFDRGSMYSKVVRQYLDFYPYLTVQRKAYKKRAMNDSAGGASQKA